MSLEQVAGSPHWAFAGQWSHLKVLGPLVGGAGCGSSTRDPRASSSSACQLLRVPVTHAGDPGPRGGWAGFLWIGSTPPMGQGPLLEPFPSSSIPALAPLHQVAGGGPGH